MDRDQATFQAYDGVEILLDGVVVRAPDFTVAEAIHFIRLSTKVADGEVGAVFTFLREFVPRAGLSGVPLSALRMDLSAFPSPKMGEETLGRAMELAERLADAQEGDPDAQYEFLEEFVVVAGLDPKTPAGEVFEMGVALVIQIHLHVYRLSRNFLDTLVAAPATRVMFLTGATMPRNGMPDLMT